MRHFHFERPPLARHVVDHEEDLRSQPDVLRAGWPAARVLRVDDRGAAVVAGTGLVFVDAIDVAPEPPVGAVFLGSRAGRHAWAVRTPGAIGGAVGLREVGHLLDADDVDWFASAVALLNWHDAAPFSPRDGSPTTPSVSGWTRVSGTGQVEFPRTDPAVICLVHDGADQVLLGRQAAWPKRRHSVLAGFVEAGESLEACVAREVHEEVGLAVDDITYLGSQPWPFPRSVMIAFAAVADSSVPLLFHDGEIAEARWFTRDEVRVALEAGDWTSGDEHPLLLPGPVSIARTMLSSWAAA